MRLGLKYKLLILLGCGLSLAFLGQLITRYYIEIPALAALEARSDARDVEQARLAILQVKTALIGNTIDHGAWTDTYEFIRSEPGQILFDSYVAGNLGASTFTTLDIDGGLFIAADGAVKFNGRTAVPTSSHSSGAGISADSFAFVPLPDGKRPVTDELITAGITDSNLGPVLFAASHIVTSEPPYPASRGVVIFWKLIDQRFVNMMSRAIQGDIDFIPLQLALADSGHAARLRQLNNSGSTHLPRDANGYLYWLLEDVGKQPLFLMRQQSAHRGFSPELVSTSVIVGFSTSALILIVVIVFFSQTVIRRLLLARTVMAEITGTGEYDRRLQSQGNDEIDALYTQFNCLLSHIQEQNREMLEQNQELAALSEQDALTGIANRRYLDEVLERSWRQCARSHKALSVLMIDVDYFKLFNDKYGHPAGDRVLRSIAQTLQNSLHRATDYLARYGGEEFCVVLTDTDSAAALSVAERLRSDIENLGIRSAVSKCAEVVTVSIGIATMTPESRVFELNIIGAADEALYHAKKHGRNCVYQKSDNFSESAGRTMSS